MLVIELTGDTAPASVPGGAVYELAISLGISSHRARRLRVMVDELVILAQKREHGDRPAEVSVRAWTDQGHLRVEVTDQGIPVFTDDAVVPHELVRLGFAEFIDLHAHGRDGNVARCSLAVSDHDARDSMDGDDVLSHDAPEIHEPGEFVVRAMSADECGDLARLVYRCYGYDYPSEDIYFPQRMAALIEEGLMHSAVVVNDQGVLVGHASLTMTSTEARVAEAGKLVVDPRYRSHGLARKMASLRLERAAELELVGLWTECVSNHPYSQRNQRKLGAVETGIFLGILPETVMMTGLENETSVRGSLVAMFFALPNAPARTLYVPPRYSGYAQEIVESLTLERVISTDGRVASEPGRLSVSVSTAFNIAVICVEEVGCDFLEQLETRLDELQDMRVSAVYLDLPTSDPGTAHVGEHLAGFGFFFSALLPESGRDGDVLRLQFLDHEHVAPEHLNLASPWGARLLGMCLEDRDRVASHLHQLRLSD